VTSIVGEGRRLDALVRISSLQFGKSISISILERERRVARLGTADFFQYDKKVLLALHHAGMAGLTRRGKCPDGQLVSILAVRAGETVAACGGASRLAIRPRLNEPSGLTGFSGEPPFRPSEICRMSS
jgi:hypothetical protein